MTPSCRHVACHPCVTFGTPPLLCHPLPPPMYHLGVAVSSDHSLQFVHLGNDTLNLAVVPEPGRNGSGKEERELASMIYIH